MARPRKEHPKVRIQISLEPENIQGVENTLQRLRESLKKDFSLSDDDLKEMNRSWLIRELLGVLGSEEGFQLLYNGIKLLAPQKVGK